MMIPSQMHPSKAPVASGSQSVTLRRAVFSLKQDHLALCLLLIIAAFPLFGELGEDYLWADEGDTAVLAKSILQFGVPKAWDGVTFTDSDKGARENKDLVMVSHPWLQYYVTAASFSLFGETPFAARIPFAAAGWMTIIVLYTLVLRMTKDHKAALCAGILLVVSVQFLLYSRQCRNYALSMLLTCLLLVLFFELKNARRAAWFGVVGILLFHCHPSGLAPLGALALLTLFYAPFRRFRLWFWLTFPVILVFTLPWFFLARTGYNENTKIVSDWALFASRLLQFFIEWGSVTPVVAVILLFSWLWIRTRRAQAKSVTGRAISRQLLDGTERDLVVTILFIVLAYSVLIALTIPRVELWTVGLRHTTAVIPLTYALVGLLVSKTSRRSAVCFVVLVALLAVTKVGRLTPWSFWHEEKVTFDPADIASMHVPKTWTDRFLRTALPAFSRELLHPNHGTVANVCKFLKTNAAPGEVLITNYEWEPLYFHTGLPQGLKVLPTYSIYDHVQQLGLPFYVYTVKDARWIVWRGTWDNYNEYNWQSVYESLLESGAKVTPVASLAETAWENRPNIHFHRYPGDDYKFPFYKKLQNVNIYRVDWPWTKQHPNK